MIALVLVLAVLALALSVVVVFRKRAAPHSMWDHTEYGFPPDLRKAYVDHVVNKLVPASWSVLAGVWQAGTDEDRTKVLTAVSQTVDDGVVQIRKQAALASMEALASMQKKT